MRASPSGCGRVLGEQVLEGLKTLTRWRMSPRKGPWRLRALWPQAPRVLAYRGEGRGIALWHITARAQGAEG